MHPTALRSTALRAARSLGALVALTLVTARCEPRRTGGMPSCTDPNFCPGSETPSGGGGGASGGDAGARLDARPSLDGAIAPTRIAVSGSLAVLLQLPPVRDVTGSRTEAGWIVEPLTGTSTSLGMTDADGAFVVDGVPSIGAEVTLRATPPMGRGLYGAIGTYAVTGPSLRAALYAVSTDAFDRAALGTGMTPNPSSAHAVIELLGAASLVQGVSASVLGVSTATVAYDETATSFSVSSGRTGTRGIVLLLNADVPREGGDVTLQLARAGATANVRLRLAGGAIAWVSTTPP